MLVPREHLIKLTESYVNRIQEENISLQENWNVAWDLIAAQFAKEFEISPEVVEKCLTKDKVMNMYY